MDETTKQYYYKNETGDKIKILSMEPDSISGFFKCKTEKGIVILHYSSIKEERK